MELTSPPETVKTASLDVEAILPLPDFFHRALSLDAASAQFQHRLEWYCGRFLGVLGNL